MGVPGRQAGPRFWAELVAYDRPGEPGEFTLRAVPEAFARPVELVAVVGPVALVELVAWAAEALEALD